MESIITKDGSITFRSKIHSEPYHSRSGALEEAFEKYSIPMKIWQRENPIIYDVCSGMGYNAAAALDVFIEKCTKINDDENEQQNIVTNNNAIINQKSITIYCYENDEEIIKKTLEVNPQFKHYYLLKELVKNYFEKQNNILEQEISGIKIKLVLRVGDARELIAKESERADFVFFDPFSPTKHAEMWVESVFQMIFSMMNSKSILATYSYARITKDNLAKAGFRVTAGPIIGRRSPSTIAFKD